METLKKLRDHPNVLTLRAVAYVGAKGAEQEAFLLLDLCRESLVEHLRAQEAPLPDADVLTIFHSVCRAVALMHHQNPPLSHRHARGAACHELMNPGRKFRPCFARSMPCTCGVQHACFAWSYWGRCRAVSAV